ncbi:TMhelix containing protein [Vibrio phage 1.079.O._10N.286.45.E9]|nr:TMhelix containing protein [Vibrio phage 1.079.O._10N.286.45.E9]
MITKPHFAFVWSGWNITADVILLLVIADLKLSVLE